MASNAVGTALPKRTATGCSLLGLHAGILLVHLSSGTSHAFLALDFEDQQVAGPKQKEEDNKPSKGQDAGLVILGLDVVGREQLGKVGCVTKSRGMVHVNDDTIVDIFAVLFSVHDCVTYLCWFCIDGFVEIRRLVWQ